MIDASRRGFLAGLLGAGAVLALPAPPPEEAGFAFVTDFFEFGSRQGWAIAAMDEDGEPVHFAVTGRAPFSLDAAKPRLLEFARLNRWRPLDRPLNWGPMPIPARLR